MNNKSLLLPEEVKKRIEKEAEESAMRQDMSYSSSRYSPWEAAMQEHKAGYELGAEVEALCAEELRKEKEDLKRRLDEAMTLLDPIIDYGQGNPLYKQGCSITVEVLNRAKLYDQHYQEMRKMIKQAKKLLESAYPHIHLGESLTTNIWKDWCNELIPAITKALRQEGGSGE